jgi:hypothetical protein
MMLGQHLHQRREPQRGRNFFTKDKAHKEKRQPIREKKNEDKVSFQRASPLMRVWTESFGNSKSVKFQKEGSLY